MHWSFWCADPTDVLICGSCSCTNPADVLTLLIRWACWISSAVLNQQCWYNDTLILLMHWSYWCTDPAGALMLLMLLNQDQDLSTAICSIFLSKHLSLCNIWRLEPIFFGSGGGQFASWDSSIGPKGSTNLSAKEIQFTPRDMTFQCGHQNRTEHPCHFNSRFQLY